MKKNTKMFTLSLTWKLRYKKIDLTFDNENDYDKIQEDDVFNFTDLKSFSPNKSISLEIIHSNNSKEIIKLNHTFNSQQIEWYKNGSALNLIKANNLSWKI